MGGSGEVVGCVPALPPPPPLPLHAQVDTSHQINYLQVAHCERKEEEEGEEEGRGHSQSIPHCPPPPPPSFMVGSSMCGLILYSYFYSSP